MEVPGLEELRHRPMVFVEDLVAPVLSTADRHHLERSLRMQPGAELTVADGRGSWRRAIFGPQLVADGETVNEPWPTRQVTIAFAPVKGDRSDLVVQKLTELGVGTIVPILSLIHI